MFKKMDASLKEKINKPLLITAFSSFVIIFVWIVIFKANYYTSLGNSIDKMINLNFIDRFIHQFKIVKYSSGACVYELLLNIIIFIPLTLYLPLLFNKISLKRDTLLVFLTTLFIEFFQLLTGLGGFEFFDIFLNFLGGMFGYLIFKKLKPSTSDKIINYINLVTIIIFLPLAIFAITNTIIHYEYYIPFFDGTGIRNLFTIN